MELIDVVAVLGALAWTPHLITVVKGIINKPKVRIITNRAPEIGFTTLGSIFNIRLAFSVEHKDIVVSGIKVKLRHESGEEKLFEWQGIRQQTMKMTAPDGSVMPFEKEVSVLAIKLNQKDIEERHIQFQESSFLKAKNQLESIALKKQSFLKQREQYDSNQFMSSQEMSEIYGYIKQAFSWKTGKYFVQIEVESNESFEISDDKYEFELTSLDIETLEENKSKIEMDYKNMLVQQSKEEYQQVVWNWRYPRLDLA